MVRKITFYKMAMAAMKAATTPNRELDEPMDAALGEVVWVEDEPELELEPEPEEPEPEPEPELELELEPEPEPEPEPELEVAGEDEEADDATELEDVEEVTAVPAVVLVTEPPAELSVVVAGEVVIPEEPLVLLGLALAVAVKGMLEEVEPLGQVKLYKG